MSGTPNVYELLGRSNKADKLIAAIAANGWDRIVPMMGPEHWAVVAKSAGVNSPSDETIALVKQRMAQASPASASPTEPSQLRP